MIESLNDLVAGIDDPRAKAVEAFHRAHNAAITAAKGSSANHQAWPGGYCDHIAEVLRIARSLYATLSAIRPLPFKRASAEIVLYFHDIEKIWKYTTGLPAGFDKKAYLLEALPREWGIRFTEEEQNALEYVHGEGSDHRGDKRVMNELAAFVHACDVLSARLWHSDGRGLG